MFALPWPPSAFRRELDHKGTSDYLVLRHLSGERTPKRPRSGPRLLDRALRLSRSGRSLLGYAGLWMVVEEAHICTLAVRPEWRGRGLGELLLASLINRVLERKARVITLEVRVSNIPAQNLYLKYGFALVGRRRSYYSDNREDALLMTAGPICSTDYRCRFRRLTRLLRERLTAELDLPGARADP